MGRQAQGSVSREIKGSWQPALESKSLYNQMGETDLERGQSKEKIRTRSSKEDRCPCLGLV